MLYLLEYNCINRIFYVGGGVLTLCTPLVALVRYYLSPWLGLVSFVSRLGLAWLVLLVAMVWLG
jgi:hypothetical protein